MINSKKIIRDYAFNDETPKTLIDDNFYTGWPVVYVINDDKEMYIGETYHAPERMKQHLEREDRRRLSDLHIIGTSEFTKSATLDIESSLIELCKIENVRKLQNANDGLVNHHFANKAYFRKDSEFFAAIWKELKNRGLVESDIELLLNSDIFKFSPYKSLNAEQCVTRDGILQEILDCLTNNEKRTIFVNGSAGTGKTILAIYLMKLLVTNAEYITDSEDGNSDTLPFVETVKEIKKIKPDLKVAYVVAMESLRATLKEVFSHIDGLKKNMIIGPGEVTKSKYDVLIVDEAHRLKQRKNLENGFVFTAFDENNKKMGLDNNGTQLDWILKNSTVQILFYDAEQTIKPTDVNSERFNNLINKKNNSIYLLSSQMRCIAGKDYINYVKNILNEKEENFIDFEDKYDFYLFDDINKFCNQILYKEKSDGLARIVSGYGFKWVSKKDPQKKDIKIENRVFYWNKKDKGWPLSIQGNKVVDEIGCIHTIQGYDLNYCGVIFGPEIAYRNGKIVIFKENYYDINGKDGTDDSTLKKYILNIYATLLTRGIKGTYVYVCDDKLREYLAKYIKHYR